MIIKSTRIKRTSGPDRPVGHVFHGPENEKIRVLAGSKDVVLDAFAVCETTYAVRHVVISPQHPLEESHALAIARMYMKEFHAEDHPCVLVEHTKARADGVSSDTHYHLMVQETHPETGAIMCDRHNFLRHEKLARLAELRVGQELVPGRHTKAVVKALREDGYEREALILEASHIMHCEKPESSFSSKAFQCMKRQGVSLSKVRHFVRDAYDRSLGGDEFLARLGKAGLTVGAGDKAGFWIVRKAGKDLGALHRLLKVKPAQASEFLATTAPKKADPRKPGPKGPDARAVKGRETTRKDGEDWVDSRGVVHVAEEAFDKNEAERQLKQRTPGYTQPKPRF